MVNTNPGFLSTLSNTPSTRIVDGTDNIHSGIINALNVATGGNAVISGFNITQEDGGTYTQYDVAAGKILRDGILVDVSARNNVAPGVGARADNDWYATVVVDSSNVIQIRTGGSGVSTASVSTLSASDIPVAIIKYPAGTDHDAVDRPVQFLGYNGSTRGLSILNSGSETLRINANATLTKGSATLTLPSSTGTIALTSDITYTSAISEGNSGLVPSGGVGTSNIANDAVTYAKLQNVSGTDKILGRDSSGAGIVEELTPANVRTMLGIETGATADQSNAEIETAYNAQVSQVSSSERTAGTETDIKRYAPADIKSMIDTHQTDTNTDVTTANLKTKLNSDFGSDFTIGSQSNDTAIFTGHLTVGGNLTVNGATQTINSTVVTIDDPVFTLGGDGAGSNDNKDRGVEFKWHDGSSAKVGFFGFDDSAGKFTFIPDATNSSEVFSGTAGTIVANLEGAVTGNASTATALATSRNFSITGDVTAGAVGFTGAGNVALSTTLADDAVATAKIADDAVTSAKIADDTIATGNLADDSVTFAKMQDTSTNNRVLGATTAGTIGEVQVATAMVADDAITSAKIADDAVGADQLASNAVVNASIASNAAIAQSKVDGLVSALSGKEPSQTIGDGLDRTGSTLKVDIDGLTIENGIDRTADFIMYDDATNGLRRINPANLFGLLIASDIPDISSAYRATGTAIVNADISNSAAISADKIANGSTNKVFTSTLKTKLDGIEASATAGADFSSNVSNISVTNAQLAGSIANTKLANSSVTINSNSLNLGGTLTLDTDDIGEGSNKYYTDERVDDRVNALITDGEGITTTYNDGSNTLTLAAELATTSNKGVASFTSDMFDVSSGVVSLKNGAVKNAQIASDAAIAQSKIQNLTTNLASKIENLGDLSITSSATELNVLDGIPATLTATELGYVDGVTSSIQTQLNTKLESVAVADLTDINSLSTSINNNSTHTQLATAKAIKDFITQQQVEDKDYQISVELSGSTPLIKIEDQFGGSSTLQVTGGDRITTGVTAGRLTISDSGKGAVASVSFNQGLLTLTHDDGTTSTATLPDATTDAHGLMTDDQFDKLAGIEAQADVTDKANVVASLGLLNESDTLYLGDAGNDTSVRIRGNLFVDGTTTTINQTEINVQDAIKFEGASADDHETTLRIVDPTADRVISLPDITGTLITTGDTGTIATGMIAASAVTTGKINSNAITTGKLAGSAVTTAKIADDAVTGAKIDFIDDSIAATDTHIMVADGTDYNNVAMSGDATLANDGVLTIANLAVETGMLANLGVTTAKIAADAITGAKIADDAIDSEHYTDGSIDTAHIGNDQVTYAKIQNVSADERILGRVSGANGVIEELTKAQILTMINVEDGADVTDATNVNAAGAVMHTDIPDSDTGFVKRTGSETYDIDTSTYLTAVAIGDLTGYGGGSDLAILDQNLASVSSNHDTLASAKAVKAYVDSIPGGVGGMSFVLEDGDGTELTIANDKEIKFVPSSLLTINWTDTSDGSDSDPYDLTFTVDNDLANYDNSNSSFATTTALTNATAATAITGKALTNLGSGTGGTIAATDTILAAMQKLETRTALNDAKVTNTDVNVNVTNLTARLPQITESVTIGDATDVTVTTSGALVVTGNLTVNGTTTTLDTTNLAIEDKNIVLGTGNSGSEVLDATGLTLEGGSGDDVTFQYNASADRMELKHGSAFEDFKAGTIIGTFTGDLTGDVTGNADTATTLATARTIAGKSFNGSANITIATTDLSDISALDTDLSSVSGSDDSLATAKAIKTYVDAQVDTEDTLGELDDTNIGVDTSLAAGHLIIYDSVSGLWDNAIPTGSDTSTIDMTVTGGNGTLAISADLKNPDGLTVITDDGAGSTLTATGTDEMMVWDASESAWRVITLANLSDFAIQNGSGGVSAFKTISVSGQDDIVADATADTLTLGGTSIAITSTASSDTLAFNVNIDGLTATPGGTSLHQTEDHFMFSDNGTEKKITFSNLEDEIFANVSGDATIAAGGALTIAAGAVENSMLADDAVGADELAANAVVNASIASGAAIDMDKLDGDSLATAITDFAQDDLMILSDTSDSGNLVKMTTSNFEDAIFGNVSGDIAIAAGGAATIQANSVALGTDTTGNYMTDVSAGTGIDVTHTAAEGSTATIAVDVSDFMSNGANNRILTATGTDAMNAEANLTFDGSTLEIVATGAAGGIGVSMQNNEGKFLAYTDGGNFVIKDYQIDTGGSTDGTDLYPFKIEGGSANDSLVVSNGLVTLGGDLKVGGNDIKSSSGDTVITLSNNDATFADDLTIGSGNKLFIDNSYLRDDGANLKVYGNTQTQYQVSGQYGAHIFYTQDGSSSDNLTEVFKVNYLGNLELGNNRDRLIEVKDTAHDAAGKDLTISAGDTTAGTTDNIAGGDLIFEGGIGKGTGAGGDILFKVANEGSSGSTLNSLATAMTISDDTNISTASNLTVGGNLIVSGDSITVNAETITTEEAMLSLGIGQTSNDTDALDFGFYGTYDVGGTQKYRGIFADASVSGKFKLFKDLQVEPTTTVNTGGTGFALADLKLATLEATTLDISGNADIDGTLEADAITVNGDTLAEVVQDTVGAMFSSNTETNITATYQDADGTIDLEVAAGTVGDGLTLANGADNRIITATGAAALNGESALTFDGTTMSIRTATDHPLVIENTTNAGYAGIQFSDNSSNSYGQKGEFRFNHADGSSEGSGASFHFTTTEADLSIVGGKFIASDSSASEPGFAFSGDVNTGLFQIDADDIALVTSGSERLTVTNGGLVGIGTTSPVSMLHVHKNAYDFDDGTQDEDGDFHLMLKSGQNSTAGDAVSIGFAQSSDGTTVGAKISHVIENSFSRGSLVFSTNDTASAGDTTAERMRITAAGNVGIGTTSPSTELHLSGADHPSIRVTGTDNANADPAIELLGTADNFTEGGQLWYDNGTGVLHLASLYNNDAADIQFHTKTAADRSTSNVRMTIAGDGKVGIGDTNPIAAKLHVEVSGDTTTYASTNETYRYAMLLRNNTDTTDAFTGIAFDVSSETDFDSMGASIAAVRDTSAGSTAANHDANLVFATNDAGDDGLSDRMRITHDGLVGIGTTSPSSALHVNGGSGEALPLILERPTTGGANFGVGIEFTMGDADSATAGHIYGRMLACMDGANGNVNGSEDGYLRFDTSLNGSITEAMRILSSGNVGIGTTSPAFPLEVDGFISTASGIVHMGDTNNTITFGTDTQSFNTDSNTRMHIDADGHIEIPADSKKLKIGASGDLEVYHDGSNSYVAEVGTGNLKLTSNGAAVDIQKGTSEYLGRFLTDGAVELYHNNSKKFETTSTGVTVTGTLAATAKSFVIQHPTEKGKMLKHGSLEGPEHGVYIRGRLEGDVIELPDYWLGLVDEDTITVQLTPNKGFQQIYVDHIEDNKVYVGTQTDTPIDCFYFIQAERKDVEKMVVEY